MDKIAKCSEKKKIVILDIDSLLFYIRHNKQLMHYRNKRKKKSTLQSLSRLVFSNHTEASVTLDLELRPYITSFLSTYTNLFQVFLISKEKDEVIQALLEENRVSDKIAGKISNFQGVLNFETIKKEFNNFFDPFLKDELLLKNLIVFSCSDNTDMKLRNNWYKASKFFGSKSDVQLKILRNCASFLSKQQTVVPLKIKIHEALIDFHQASVDDNVLQPQPIMYFDQYNASFKQNLNCEEADTDEGIMAIKKSHIRDLTIDKSCYTRKMIKNMSNKTRASFELSSFFVKK